MILVRVSYGREAVGGLKFEGITLNSGEEASFIIRIGATEDAEQIGRIDDAYIIEHLLIETLCAFYEVGEHGIIKLRGADWNDALDMASKRGESVAFTFAYAMNLEEIADVLEEYSNKTGRESVTIAKEIMSLLKCENDVDRSGVCCDERYS